METSRHDPMAPLRLNIGLVRQVLVRFLHDEITNAGFAKAILGVSGGVDSALAAMLAAEALGKENVLGVLMPYRSSNPKSAEDALKVVSAAGIRHETVDISAMVDAYCETHKVAEPLRRGNVMARMRMIVLYDLSVREKALVVGTSNKTEILVGYGTQFGDLASAVNPLGDLYKTQVWHLAEAAGVPREIVTKPPTADLWEGQTDEAEIGFTYADLDALLFRMVDDRRTDKELVKMGFDAANIERVRTLIRKSQFKRRLPLIAKISSRTVNVDFRYVRDWGM